ncbi:MAG: DNA repair protein RecN [Alphaproteobacteria bacterium]
MLEALNIQNVVIIEKLNIEFRKGLCTLTGETGAGKSILLDSLSLALGMRAESSLVRKGADKAVVSASFSLLPEHSLYTILHEADILVEKGETIVLKRSLSADGRSKAYINDSPVSVGFLRQAGQHLIEIHGQFDTQGLLDASTHRALLDEYAGLDHPLGREWNQYQDARQSYETLQSETQKSRADEEYLRTSLEDIDALEPQEGEEQSLAALRERLMHREQVMEALNTAYHLLQGENDPVSKASGVLDRVCDKMGEDGQNIMGALDRAGAEIQEAVSAIQSLCADMDHEEHDLQSIDDRLFSLRGLARKHGCAVNELAAKRAEIAAKLNAIDHADDLLAEAGRKVERTREEFITKAREVSDIRKKAAQKLDTLVMKELAPLKLERARFETSLIALEESDWGAQGIDRVRFQVATNPGAEPGPLNKIASGGEMSRFMLALKVVMAETGVAESLIFDEVDAGIGGATADAVGERLARLSKDKQILVVTHSPQVAARADHHWIVRKDGGDIVTTSVVPLPSRPERSEEIARMLSGATITQEARAAADKLLEASAA